MSAEFASYEIKHDHSNNLSSLPDHLHVQALPGLRIVECHSFSKKDIVPQGVMEIKNLI